MTEYDVVVYGPIFCDLIFTGIPALPHLGEELYAEHLTVSLGGSAIVANGLNRLGLKVGLITDIGSDPLSQILWGLLEESHIDRTLIRKFDSSLQHVTVGLSYPDDRAFVTRFEEHSIPPDLEYIFNNLSTQHIHICSFLAALENPQAVKIAHDYGATVSADFGWDKNKLCNPKLIDFLSNLDLFLPSKVEALRMSQESLLFVAAEKILMNMRFGDLYIKDGCNGVYGFLQSLPNQLHVPAIPVNVTDTTGAGDAFDAGFIFAYLNKMSPITCMQYGVICGGLSTTASGGIEGFPNIPEVEEWHSKLQL